MVLGVIMEVSPERGLWLKELTRLKGFTTLAEVALAVHTTRQTVSDWYQGGGIKKIVHQAALCKLLGITRAQLFEGPYQMPHAPMATSQATYNRRGSGWTRPALLEMMGALLPAYEETLQRKGEDEVIRLLQLQLAEMAPSPRTMKDVTDAMRKALYSLEDNRAPTVEEFRKDLARWAYGALKARDTGDPEPPFLTTGRPEPYEPDPKRPKDWGTGWPVREKPPK